jgi:hypothetical protein
MFLFSAKNSAGDYAKKKKKKQAQKTKGSNQNGIFIMNP